MSARFSEERSARGQCGTLGRSALAALLLVALTGCGTPVRGVRLDTGQGEPHVHVPPGRHAPVELKREVLTRALGVLARDVRTPPRLQQAARRLFEVEARSGAYRYEPRGRLTPLGPGEHLEGAPSAAEVELTRAYLGWCERTGRPGDCLHLLEEGPTVTGDGRYALAMALAQGAVLDEMLEAFKGMADPHAMVATVLWTWTTYLVLLSIPDVTVTKGLAAVMTVTFIAYVGVDTFWSLVVGFKRLVDEADRATTFQALREAGERYGKVMGRNAARAFALLATVALGNTASGLAAKVPTLPGAVVAAANAETQMGLRLAAVGEVETVAVSADSVTLVLAPGAVAMAAQGPGGGGTNSTTTRQHAGTTYRFNTGHAFNRAHKTGADLRNTALNPEEVETAIMRDLHAYRAAGGSLPVAQNGAVPTPYMGRVTIGAYTIEFSAVQTSNNTVFVGTYYLLP